MDNLPTTINFKDPAIIATLKNTVAYGLTDPEFQLFAQFCGATGLNPFKKEIWAIKVSNRLQLMTGINGYVTIANRHPQYDGMEEGLIGKSGEYLPLTYPGKDFIGAWVKVYRKDRRVPSEGVAMMAEYDKQQGTWKAMPRVMIGKCAQSVALRKAFSQELNGLYTAEEMPVEFSVPQEKVVIHSVPVGTTTVTMHQVEEVDQDTGEIKTVSTAQVPPPSLETIPDRRNIQWDKYKYRYRVPTWSDTLDIPAIRTALKENGAQWRPRVTKNIETGIKYKVEGGNDCWYANTSFPELAEYCQFNSDQEINISNDELPESMGAV